MRKLATLDDARGADEAKPNGKVIGSRRKPYSKPALQRLGHVANVTKKSGTVTPDNLTHPSRP